MTEDQFDALVTLMRRLAWRAAGLATHQQRAGSEEDDIEEARRICVDDLDDI